MDLGLAASVNTVSGTIQRLPPIGIVATEARVERTLAAA